MNIINKLTLKFTSIVAAIILVASLTIYFSSAEYRQNDFYNRLEERAVTTARLLVDVNEVDKDLLRIIDNSRLSLPDEQVVVYNYLDEVLYNSLDSEPVYSKDLIDKVRLEKEIQFEENGKEFLGLLFEGQYDRFVVIASAFDQFGYGKLRNLRLVLIIVFFGSMVITYLSGMFYSRNALKPVSKVIKEVDTISLDNIDKRVDTGNGHDELAQLAITFNKMLDRLEKSFQMQKNFVSNVSHEMRTPITSLMGQIEVALLKSRTEMEYQNVLNSLLEDSKNLKNLFNSLLDLSRLETSFAVIAKIEFRIDELLLHIVAELSRNHPDNRINFEVKGLPENEKQFEIFGSENLVKTAIVNLIENALKFSERKPVEVSLTPEEEMATIEIKDLGIGIPQDEREKIFEPFHRGKNALGIQGHGLGLSLTKIIVEQHGGNISLQSKPGQGTRIVVKLPNTLGDVSE